MQETAFPQIIHHRSSVEFGEWVGRSRRSANPREVSMPSTPLSRDEPNAADHHFVQSPTLCLTPVQLVEMHEIYTSTSQAPSALRLLMTTVQRDIHAALYTDFPDPRLDHL